MIFKISFWLRWFRSAFICNSLLSITLITCGRISQKIFSVQKFMPHIKNKGIQYCSIYPETFNKFPGSIGLFWGNLAQWDISHHFTPAYMRLWENLQAQGWRVNIWAYPLTDIEILLNKIINQCLSHWL